MSGKARRCGGLSTCRLVNGPWASREPPQSLAEHAHCSRTTERGLFQTALQRFAFSREPRHCPSCLLEVRPACAAEAPGHRRMPPHPCTSPRADPASSPALAPLCSADRALCHFCTRPSPLATCCWEHDSALSSVVWGAQQQGGRQSPGLGLLPWVLCLTPVLWSSSLLWYLGSLVTPLGIVRPIRESAVGGAALLFPLPEGEGGWTVPTELTAWWWRQIDKHNCLWVPHPSVDRKCL